MELFGVKRNLGSVADYKLLVGNTSLNSVNSVRVHARILVARQVNYKNSSLSDIGPITTRFVRRDLAAQRKLFGAIRAR